MRYERRLYVFCLRFLGDRAAAEDATQEIFLKVVRGLARWNARATFRTWVYTIARNQCVDAQRKRRHRKTESLDQTSISGDTPRIEQIPGAKGQQPDHAERRRVLRQVIAEGMERLSSEQREVFVLREHAGLSFPAIAEMTGVPENTVKSRMRYALEHLRKHLAEAGFERGDDA